MDTLPTIDGGIEACVDKAAELILNSDAILFTSGTGWILSNGSDINKDISTELILAMLYQIVKQWSEMNHVKYSFSFTGNIDGHWLKSGWSPSALVECYGSIHYMQCINKCRKRLVDTKDSLKFNIDPKTDRVIGRLPHCPYCKQLARPNTQAKLLVIELGADTTLPEVRNESASTFIDRKWTANIIRINSSAEDSVVESCYRNKTNNQGIEINLDPLTALTLIDKIIKKKMKQ
ncbi:unnamed protein product [Adineta steineri]|uniref:Deacetylase sirtuin-type domain-containing protein n=1 Tax=Adineta steineri TaxID=433720 RepID=A0A819RA81_9BILA|nr:unnamed protein product [Adineta steineri]